MHQFCKDLKKCRFADLSPKTWVHNYDFTIFSRVSDSVNAGNGRGDPVNEYILQRETLKRQGCDKIVGIKRNCRHVGAILLKEESSVAHPLAPAFAHRHSFGFEMH
jgi:hypothetical protein